MSPLLHFLLYTGAALALLTWGGNLFCRAVFRFTGLAGTISPDPIDPIRAGRIVGSLERLILAVGLAAGSWEILAAVIALKTVARFKELDDKRFAEYFLIGSLCSLLWASAVTGSWVAYDGLFGVNGRDRMTMIMTSPEEGDGTTQPTQPAGESQGNGASAR